MKGNGVEKLISRMIDREYAEMADLPEDKIYEDEELCLDEDSLVDESKDEDYYSNRISKGYGLTDNIIKQFTVGVKKSDFFTPTYIGIEKMIQNGQTEPNHSFGLPEGVRGYVER